MIYHETEHGILYQGDCLDIMKSLPDNSVDAVVTDPPYGLGFMGKAWDTFDKSQFGIAGNEGENDLKVKKNFNVLPRYKSDGLQDFVYAWATECLRVLKPGGYLLSFAGTRTQHRIACGIEDAGFEIRDMIAWVYGSGFPKSLDIGKAVDKLQGNERTVTGKGNPMSSLGCMHDDNWKSNSEYNTTKGNSPYEGYGTALKPALEPITVARKPISGTVAENVLKWGTGAIDIDGCRVGSDEILTTCGKGFNSLYSGGTNNNGGNTHQGRFPANLIHDGSDEVMKCFPKTIGKIGMTQHGSGTNTKYGKFKRSEKSLINDGISDSGSAARFFYCAKASKAERNAGCEGLPDKITRRYGEFEGTLEHAPKKDVMNTNYHPTVKPIALMEYLVKLVSRPGATVLDPFLGSGTTAMACVRQGRKYIGCEMDKGYCEIAAKRIESKLEQLVVSL